MYTDEDTPAAFRAGHARERSHPVHRFAVLTHVHRHVLAIAELLLSTRLAIVGPYSLDTGLTPGYVCICKQCRSIC